MLERAAELSTSWAYATDQPSQQEGELALLDNVQFIYELVLAQLELQALGVRSEMTNGLREFRLLDASDGERLQKRSAYLKYVKGRPTDYFRIIQHNRTRSVNQYLSHWIYPYKGKFHPQMIRALLNIIGLEPGDVVLDPFIGSGTTAVEAQLLGVTCIGFDISPLCVLQSRVKAESLDVLPQIKRAKEAIVGRVSTPLFSGRERALDEVLNEIGDEKTRNFYKLAKLVAISDQERRGKDFSRAFLKNLDVMVESISDYVRVVETLQLQLGQVDIRLGDARSLTRQDESVDGIVTSPPYSIALDYVSNDAHALRELGHNLAEIREGFIGVRGKGEERIKFYNEDMERSLREMYRVLKPSKFAVVIVGNATYLGETVKTVEFAIEYATRIGFQLAKNIDKIIFGLYNVMLKENILIFRKP